MEEKKDVDKNEKLITMR